MLVSVLVHSLVFLLWPGATILLESVRGRHLNRDSHTSAPVHLVRLAAPARRSASEASPPLLVRPEIDVGEPAASRPALDLARADPLPAALGATVLRRRGGSGVFVAEEERFVRPTARTILRDWRTPSRLHSVIVTARVRIDSGGAPTGLVELVRPSDSWLLNRPILDQVRRLESWPASRNGEPVAAWAEIAFVFCRTGVTAISTLPSSLLTAPCAPEF